MVVANRVAVRIKNTKGFTFGEVAPQADERRCLKYRLISAKPDAEFTVSVEVEDRFNWKGADTLFIAIAYDDGEEEHLGDSALTQAWAISRSGDYLREHTFKYVVSRQSDEAEQSSKRYRMPNAVPSATPRIDFETGSRRTKERLISHRGCISVYVHRCQFSLDCERRRPADPSSADLHNSVIENKAPFRTNFESVELLQKGNVGEFHFRNLSAEDFETTPPASSNHSAQDTGQALPAFDHGGTQNSAVARSSKGLRALRQANYSEREAWKRNGFPWNEELLSTETQQRNKKRGRSPTESVTPQVQEAGKRQRVVEISDYEDDDDEIVIVEPSIPVKSEPRPEQPTPPESIEQSKPTEETTRTPVGSKDASDESKRRRELDMELEEIELDERALDIDRKALEIEKRALEIKRRRLKMG